MIRCAALSTSICLLLACSEFEDTGQDTASPPTTTGEPLSFEADIQPILTDSCVQGCHNADDQLGDLILEASAYPAIVDVPAADGAVLDYVEPFSPADSYLWHKINGTQLTVKGGGGAAMPLGEEPLPVSELDRIEAWIDQGAPD